MAHAPQRHSLRLPADGAAVFDNPGRIDRTRSQLLRHQEGAAADDAPWSGSNVMAHLTIRLVTKQGRGLLECGVCR